MIDAPNNTFLNPTIFGLPSSLFSANPYSLGDRLYVSIYNSAVSFVSGVALGGLNAFSLLTVSSYQQNGGLGCESDSRFEGFDHSSGNLDRDWVTDQCYCAQSTNGQFGQGIV